MRASNDRIRAMLEGTPGVRFRRIHDTAGETGPFLIFLLEDQQKALSAVEKMKRFGLHNTYRIADYGLHVYSNIRALVDKVPLSPAGNPWTLAENAASVYSYQQGACPQSDALFARSVLLPIPSRLSEEQEKAAAEAVRAAVTEAAGRQ